MHSVFAWITVVIYTCITGSVNQRISTTQIQGKEMDDKKNKKSITMTDANVLKKLCKRRRWRNVSPFTHCTQQHRDFTITVLTSDLWISRMYAGLFSTDASGYLIPHTCSIPISKLSFSQQLLHSKHTCSIPISELFHSNYFIPNTPVQYPFLNFSTAIISFQTHLFNTHFWTISQQLHHSKHTCSIPISELTFHTALISFQTHLFDTHFWTFPQQLHHSKHTCSIPISELTFPQQLLHSKDTCSIPISELFFTAIISFQTHLFNTYFWTFSQ